MIRLLTQSAIVKLTNRKFLSFKKAGDYSVSLKAPGRNKHFRVHVEGTLFCIGQRKFAGLQQLVEHYQRAPIYTSQKVIIDQS